MVGNCRRHVKHMYLQPPLSDINQDNLGAETVMFVTMYYYCQQWIHHYYCQQWIHLREVGHWIISSTAISIFNRRVGNLRLRHTPQSVYTYTHIYTQIDPGTSTVLYIHTQMPYIVLFSMYRHIPPTYTFQSLHINIHSTIQQNQSSQVHS